MYKNIGNSRIHVDTSKMIHFTIEGVADYYQEWISATVN